MSFFQGNFIFHPFESKDATPDEYRLTYDPPPNWRPASRDSSDDCTSFSGRSDGFDRSSSVNDEGSSSRESSPGLEVIYYPDLSYRKEAAFQSRQANGASSVGQPHTGNTSMSSLLPVSDDFSVDDSNLDDALWDELMGVSENAAVEPQSANAASASDPENPCPDEEEEEDELLAMMTESLEEELAATQNSEQLPAGEEEDDADDDGMLAMMTDSLEKELAETQNEAQLAAEKEAAESARKKALLEKQLRVAAEKAALAAQFDNLHDPAGRRSGATATPQVSYQYGLDERLGRVDQGMVFGGSPEAMAREARRRRALKRARKSKSKSKSKPISQAITTNPARNSGERTPPTASTSVRSMHDVPRLYHQTDLLDWGLLTERMSLTTNLNVNTCYKSLGLDPERGQELSNRLREYLRTPGNFVNISRQDIATQRSRQIIAQLAHKLLCDQLWGQRYFNRPHVECGYSNVKFDTDSTCILIEFSRLLYKTVKAEERRKKAHLKSQEKKDEKNAAQHPVVSNFVHAPVGYTTPRDLLQEAVPRPAAVQPASMQPAFTQPASAKPVSARSVPAQPVFTQSAYVQSAPVQSVPVQSVSAPRREPVLDYNAFMAMYRRKS